MATASERATTPPPLTALTRELVDEIRASLGVAGGSDEGVDLALADHALSQLEHLDTLRLHTLDVSGNCLTQLGGLETQTRLRELNASRNELCVLC